MDDGGVHLLMLLTLIKEYLRRGGNRDISHNTSIKIRHVNYRVPNCMRHFGRTPYDVDCWPPVKSFCPERR